MTVAIGLICESGLVLGAEREMSLGETLRSQEQKAHILRKNDYDVAVVGSGTADLITLAVQELDRQLKDSMSAEMIRIKLKSVLGGIRRRYRVGRSGVDFKLSLLVGIKTPSEIKLLKASALIPDPIVASNFETVGEGWELVTYLMSTHIDLGQPSPSVAQGIIILAAVLKEARRAVQGQAATEATSSLYNVVSRLTTYRSKTSPFSRTARINFPKLCDR